MKNLEPNLESIEDYDGKESKEKRITVWIVILSGILIAIGYGFLSVNSEVSDSLVTKKETGITKY